MFSFSVVSTDVDVPTRVPGIIPGSSCSKLTTSLVNDSLKFQMAILQIHCYFLLIKCEHLLPYKGFSHFSVYLLM